MLIYIRAMCLCLAVPIKVPPHTLQLCQKWSGALWATAGGFQGHFVKGKCKMQKRDKAMAAHMCIFAYICITHREMIRSEQRCLCVFLQTIQDPEENFSLFLFIHQLLFYVWNTQMYFLVKTNFKRRPEVFSVKSPNVPLRPSEFRDVSSSTLPVRNQQNSWILCLDLNSGPKAGVRVVPSSSGHRNVVRILFDTDCTDWMCRPKSIWMFKTGVKKWGIN